MSICFVAAADATNVIPPLAFNVPVVIRRTAKFAVFVLDPANVMSPETVAEPALILHLLSVADPWLNVTVPFTVNAIPVL
jgi:hypothetical protein